MEFKDIFLGLGFVLVCVIAIFSFTDSLNSSYNSDVANGAEITQTRTNVEQLLGRSLLNDSYSYAQSTQPTPGQAADTGQDSLIQRAVKSIGLVDDLLGIIPALMKDAGEALNIPEIYIRIAEAVFWILFSLTLAYLLLLGVRSLIQ